MIEFTIRIRESFWMAPWGPFCRGVYLNDEAQIAAIMASPFFGHVIQIPNPLAPLQRAAEATEKRR